MRASVLVSEPDRSLRIELVEGGDGESLAQLQKLVGGFIETVTGDGWHLYCNEDGKNEGLAVNSLSTAYIDEMLPGFALRDTLVGPIVWLGMNSMGQSKDVPLEIIGGFATMTMEVWSPAKPITVVKRGNDIWVYDTQVGPAQKFAMCAYAARNGTADHDLIEFSPGLDKATWTEIRVDIMDHPEIDLHDHREDRSYG